ncbi:male sterility domain-containing protein, partial [Penicillium odoratum]|uniref:male sterility domain-containing protein n=1 Tax=Penicillium odoratum TaxID=1167516 RepID=UPI002546FAEF
RVMWDFFDGKTAFITGGSGFLGTALVFRLRSKAQCNHIYLLARGGKSCLKEKWSRSLPSDVVNWLLDPEKTTILDGDIIRPNFGLHDDEIQNLSSVLDFIVHAASSINLIHDLKSTLKHVVQPSEALAQFALQCDHVERFVYVSTAYANSHLHGLSSETDVKVEERIYPLQSISERTVTVEYKEAQARFSTIEYESNDFPWAYGYAKHLSERLLTAMFSECGRYNQLLIVRPSVIGPAECFPFPHYTVPTSSPVTMVSAMLANTPLFCLNFASSLSNPGMDATLDEVPVDVVVDRLLIHLAFNTQGCVHAVNGERGRIKAQEIHQALRAIRWLPWEPTIIWSMDSWHSKHQHWVNRIFKLLGTSFNFLDESTFAIWEGLSHEDRQSLMLFSQTRDHLFDLTSRKEHIYQCVIILSKRMSFPHRLFFRLLWSL